jgi:ubiquinone/menaquinone biosynthesis C-methylase UbiE
MEDRKQKEIEYFDKSGVKKRKSNLLLMESYKFLYDFLQKHCAGKKVLDYGCGSGVHSIFPIKAGALMVVGIDLSEKSLEVARKRAREAGVGDKVEFKVMDCENLDFSPDFFDVILDGGTFSSLDLQKALPELARVLKKDGVLVGIETFGHNPFANLKRKLNKITGKRTAWAEGHIFNEKYLELAKNYFAKINVNYFHPISWATFPFLNLPGGKILLKIFEFFDKILKSVPFLRKYSFKIVFVFSEPRK